MTQHEQEHHHVKFDDEQDKFEKDNSITIQQLSPSKLQVHLGFLKLNHTYEIQVPLDFPNQEYNDVTWIADESSSSMYSSFKSYEKTDGAKRILYLELCAKKAKLMSDLVRLCSSENSTVKLEIGLVARVLGKGQGTPMLKDGIHCTGITADDEESEASDWKGFD